MGCKYTVGLYRKALQRFYFMWKFQLFKADHPVLVLFYCSFVESILTFCFIAWYSLLSVFNENKLAKIVNMPLNYRSTTQYVAAL